MAAARFQEVGTGHSGRVKERGKQVHWEQVTVNGYERGIVKRLIHKQGGVRFMKDITTWA